MSEMHSVRLASRPSSSSIINIVALAVLAPLLGAGTVRGAMLSEVPTGGTSSYNLVGPWLATGTYQVNDVVTYGGSSYINIVATAAVTTTETTGALTNYFDQSTIVESAVIVGSTGQVVPFGGFQSTGYLNVAGATAFVTNAQLSIFDPYGIAFYDRNKNFVSGTFLNSNGYYAPGTPVPVPAGASYVRFWWQDGNMGTTPGAAVMNLGTTLQTTYTPFGVSTGGSTVTTTVPAAAPTDTTHWAVFTSSTTSTPVAASTAGPWAGKKMFILGDSIIWINQGVAAQISSTIGAVPSSKGASGPGIDAFPGRGFDSFQNGQGNTGAYLPVSASVIADVDLMVIALGTNQDSAYGLGLPTDAPSPNGTMSAQMRSMIETIMGWKPGMRIMVVGPYQSNRYNIQVGVDGLLGTQDAGKGIANAGSITVLKNINEAMKAVCRSYAIPYIDMLNESGVNFSTSALWLTDGLHPNAAGYSSFYVPYVAAQINRYAQ